MDPLWTTQIDDWITYTGPDKFKEFIQVAAPDDLDDDLRNELARMYMSAPLMMVGVTMYAVFINNANTVEILADLQSGLDRLWQTALDERDTRQLSQTELSEDEALVARLEFMRSGAEGMLAILRSYATGEARPDPNANDLLQQVRQLSASNLPRALQLFGQAGAAIIQGAPFWPLWHLEFTIQPASAWLKCLNAFYSFLAEVAGYPLKPLPEQLSLVAGRKINPKVEPEVENAEDRDELEQSPEIKQLLNVLLCGKEKLSDKQLKSLPAFTPEVVDQLIHVMIAEEYQTDESKGKGWAPIHAARLLGQSGSAKAVAPLISAVFMNDFETILQGEALSALKALGPLALPLLLETFQYSTDLDLKGSLADSLGKTGEGDERAFRALEAFYYESRWDDERMLAMMALAEQGDPRARDIFYKALKSDRDITPEGIREILGALEALDPQADPAELNRLKDRALQRYDSQWVHFDNKGQAICKDCGSLMQRSLFGTWEHVEPEPILARPGRSLLPEPVLPTLAARFAKAGRNEPCPCGSGKKFKHCHGSNKPLAN